MQLRRFKGRALPEVVSQVRAELGPEAVILHTKARPRGLLRFLHGSAVEVVAAVDERAVTVERSAPPAAPPVPGGAWGAPAPPVPGGAWGAPGAPQLQMSPALEPLHAEVAELRRLLVRFGGPRSLPSPLAVLHAWLVESGVDETAAYRVLEDVPTADANGRALAIEALTAEAEKRMLGMMRVAAAPAAPGRGTIALVGPTGAGKTTTLAKLAVRAHLEGRTPYVVSLDAISPGTPAALGAVARILGMTHEVAATAAEVTAAVERAGAAAVRLIDTPGLGRADEAGIAALASMLLAACPTEVHFVAPATMKPDDLLATLTAFGSLGVTRLLFTKLDETSTAGSLFTVAVTSGLPISYVAAGRDVPDDIQPATASELWRRVVRRERP